MKNLRHRFKMTNISNSGIYQDKLLNWNSSSFLSNLCLFFALFQIVGGQRLVTRVWVSVELGFHLLTLRINAHTNSLNPWIRKSCCRWAAVTFGARIWINIPSPSFPCVNRGGGDDWHSPPSDTFLLWLCKWPNYLCNGGKYCWTSSLLFRLELLSLNGLSRRYMSYTWHAPPTPTCTANTNHLLN